MMKFLNNIRNKYNIRNKSKKSSETDESNESDMYSSESNDSIQSIQSIQAVQPEYVFDTVLIPRRLVMVSGGECAVCDDPQGGPCTYYLNLRFNHYDKTGYNICDKPECAKKMLAHIEWLYNTAYSSPNWKRALYVFANDIPISVKRSSGDIETDWFIKKDLYPNPLHNPDSLFLLAMICANYNGGRENGTSYLLSYIWQYIYNIYNDLYLSEFAKDIKLLLEYNHDTKKMDNIILCCKEDPKDGIQKGINLDNMFDYED